MIKSVSVLLAAVLLSPAARTQAITPAVINSTSHTFTAGFYSFEWSVGELALVATMRSPNGQLFITNGFLQPDLSNNNPTRQQNFTTDEIRISPNPTYNYIDVTVFTRQQGLVHLLVYDARGKQVCTKKFISFGQEKKAQLDLSAFASGTYFLRVALEPAPGSFPKFGSFKIVKI